jgi:methenyltetrahydrofolate cyclohydrolase
LRGDPGNPLAGLSVQALTDEMSAGSGAPGSGSATAVAVALSAALVAKAARASRAHWPDAMGAAGQGLALRARALALIDPVAAAYDSAVDALRVPRTVPPGKRDASLGAALISAADVPLAIAEVAVDVAELAADVVESGESALRADAIVAALISEAAARAAVELVAVNLAVTRRDERLIRSRELLTRARTATKRAATPVT